MLQGVEYLVEGSETGTWAYMGGLSQWLHSLWLEYDWSRADWYWSGLESG